MYLSEYPYDYGQLGFLKKIKKVAKKVVKPAAHIAAAVVTGGASLAVTAAMLAAEKQKKAQAAAAAEAARQEQEMLKAIQAAPPAPPPIAAPVYVPPSTKTDGAVAPALTTTMVPSTEPMPTLSTGQPPWMTPALIGGGLLLAVMLTQRGGRS